MPVEWTQHRFAGGALALDVANTVVLRAWPDRRFDRFDDAGELPRFAEAACRFRGEELGGIGASEAERRLLIALREAVDVLFRGAATTGEPSVENLPPLLRASADAIERGGAGSLLAATAHSALALLAPDQASRIRICDNCGWLFLDRSRNGSRRWCDMAVCGNRRKAQRHYLRRKAEEATG